MPQLDIPRDEIQSAESCSLTSSAGTVASQSLSSDGSRPSSAANWQPSSTTQFNDMVVPSAPTRPNHKRQTNLIDALVSRIEMHWNQSFFKITYVHIECIAEICGWYKWHGHNDANKFPSLLENVRFASIERVSAIADSAEFGWQFIGFVAWFGLRVEHQLFECQPMWTTQPGWNQWNAIGRAARRWQQ